LIDSVYRIATGEEIVVELNGRTIIHVSNRIVFVDASKARITHLTVKNAVSSAKGTAPAVASQPSGPPPVNGDIPPSTDPGQAPLPASITALGSPNLEDYCQRNWGMHAELRFPNTWGWRCSSSSARASGERSGDQDISVTDACVERYGANAISHYSKYSDPGSWLCYQK
jgi:hypothetical protein